MWACHLKLDEKIESVLGPGQGREGRGSGSGSGGQGYGEDTLSKYRCSQRQGQHSQQHIPVLLGPCRKWNKGTDEMKSLHSPMGLRLLCWTQLWSNDIHTAKPLQMEVPTLLSWNKSGAILVFVIQTMTYYVVSILGHRSMKVSTIGSVHGETKCPILWLLIG